VWCVWGGVWQCMSCCISAAGWRVRQCKGGQGRNAGVTLDWCQHAKGQAVVAAREGGRDGGMHMGPPSYLALDLVRPRQTPWLRPQPVNKQNRSSWLSQPKAEVGKVGSGQWGGGTWGGGGEERCTSRSSCRPCEAGNCLVVPDTLAHMDYKQPR